MQRTSSRSAHAQADATKPPVEDEDLDTTTEHTLQAMVPTAVRRERGRAREGIDPELLKLYAELPVAMHAQYMFAGMLRGLAKPASWRLAFAAIGLGVGGALALAITHNYYSVFVALAATWAGAMIGGYFDERWRARARLRALRDEAERQNVAAEIAATGNRDGPAIATGAAVKQLTCACEDRDRVR